MARQDTPHGGLHALAWDVIADAMRAHRDVRTVRVCRHCGTLAAAAAWQAEPICNRHGMPAAHSYVDLALPVSVADFTPEVL